MILKAFLSPAMNFSGFSASFTPITPLCAWHVFPMALPKALTDPASNDYETLKVSKNEKGVARKKHEKHCMI